MTDTEMLKLCAEAMGVEGVRLGEGGPLYKVPPEKNDYIVTNPLAYLSHPLYDPLYDDMQAMALVKMFELTIDSPFREGDFTEWEVSSKSEKILNDDLNRAIVECVAKMQLGIKAAP